ncbi:hypothetical protein NOR53_311 [gamma proteobacterium NOR5-3]|nr:hypothetical protein NOR53_311 [gamma proteobacterium NOR5-3]
MDAWAALESDQIICSRQSITGLFICQIFAKLVLCLKHLTIKDDGETAIIELPDPE